MKYKNLQPKNLFDTFAQEIIFMIFILSVIRRFGWLMTVMLLYYQWKLHDFETFRRCQTTSPSKYKVDWMLSLYWEPSNKCDASITFPISEMSKSNKEYL